MSYLSSSSFVWSLKYHFARRNKRCSSLYFLQYPVASFSLDPNTSLSTLFSINFAVYVTLETKSHVHILQKSHTLKVAEREVEWSDASEGYVTCTLPQGHPHTIHPVLPFTRIWSGVSIASDTPCRLADVDISRPERNKARSRKHEHRNSSYYGTCFRGSTIEQWICLKVCSSLHMELTCVQK